LQRVFSTHEVSIYAVPHPQPIVDGPGNASVVEFRESRLEINVTRAGKYLVAVRWSPYWRASTGCLVRSPDGMVDLQARKPGVVRIAFDVDVHSLLAAFAGTKPKCRPSYDTSRTSSDNGLRFAPDDHASAVRLAGLRARSG
jgi:hypothetical protein